MKKATRFILHQASGRNVLLAGAAFLLLAVLIMPAAIRDFLRLSGKLPPVDLLPWYTPDTAFEYLSAYGQEGRSLYRFILLTADLVFPVVYSAFLSLLLGWLIRKKTWGKEQLILLPLLVCLLDVLENGCIVAMLEVWPEWIYGLAAASGAITFLKWMGIFLVAGIAGVLALKSEKGLVSKINRIRQPERT